MVTITFQRTTTKQQSSLFSGKNRVTPSVAAPGDTYNLGDQWLKCKIRVGGTLHSGLGP